MNFRDEEKIFIYAHMFLCFCIYFVVNLMRMRRRGDYHYHLYKYIIKRRSYMMRMK
jgi:hypothetical protein